MNTKLLALASALLVTTTLASAAEAGGGIRLGFGGPLGTFVATPALGGGGGSYRKHAAKKKAPVQQAARKAIKPGPRIAKAETSKAAAPTAVAKKTGTVTEETPRVTGSSALIQGSIPAEEQEGATPEGPAVDVKADAQPVSEESVSEVSASDVTTKTVTASTDKTPDASDTCKKFIPAIGMTVTVGCGE